MRKDTARKTRGGVEADLVVPLGVQHERLRDLDTCCCHCCQLELVDALLVAVEADLRGHQMPNHSGAATHDLAQDR